MGYQESYVTTSSKKRFQKIVDRIREVGKEHYHSYGVYPVEIITFHKSNDFFKKGQKAVYFVGERWIQRTPSNVLKLGFDNDFRDIDLGEDIKAQAKFIMEMNELEKYHVQIIFTEYVDAEGIWKDAGEIDLSYVTHEPFLWEEPEYEANYFFYHHMDMPTEDQYQVEEAVENHDFKSFMEMYKKWQKGRKDGFCYLPDKVMVSYGDKENDYFEMSILNKENFERLTYAECECG